jgi:hypothetical protein
MYVWFQKKHYRNYSRYVFQKNAIKDVFNQSIDNIAAELKNDQRECHETHSAQDVSVKMVHATLHKDLQVLKKSARWVTKLF